MHTSTCYVVGNRKGLIMEEMPGERHPFYELTDTLHSGSVGCQCQRKSVLKALRLLEEQLNAVPVRMPVYVCGLARSGSTLLHEIVASAPGSSKLGSCM